MDSVLDSVGFLATAPVARPDWMDADLLPERVLTVSTCLADPVIAVGWSQEPWFGDLAAARRAAGADRTVLDVGVRRADVPALLADIADAGADSGTVTDRLRDRIPLAGGEPLGWEPVGYDTGAWHTVHCFGGLTAELSAATGARPGGLGLYADDDARRAARWLTEHEAGNHVGLWVPVLLVSPPAG